jgi:hypothetical protein
VRTLPPKMVQALAPFAPLFSKRIWQHAQLLLIGAILAPGRRTVSSALRAMGLDQYKRFHRYHRVLSRARWSSLEASRILLGRQEGARWIGAKGPQVLDGRRREGHPAGLGECPRKLAFSDVVIIVRRLIREGWVRYRWEGRPSRRP